MDFAWDLERIPWPDELHGASEIRACHVLEHIIRFDPFWSELARALIPGGIVHAWVPYGIQGWKSNPFHAHPWYAKTVLALCVDSACLLAEGRGFELVFLRVLGHGFPWWHLEHHLGLSTTPPWPWRREIEFVLRKVNRL